MGWLVFLLALNLFGILCRDRALYLLSMDTSLGCETRHFYGCYAMTEFSIFSER